MKRLLTILLLLYATTVSAGNWRNLFKDDPSIQVDLDIEFYYTKGAKIIDGFTTWIKRPDGSYVKGNFSCQSDTLTIYEKGQYINRVNLDPSSGWWKFYEWGCSVSPNL